MSNEIRNFSSLFPLRSDGGLERIESARKLQEPRQLYSTASLLHPPKWPIECQVLPEKIEHRDIPPISSEQFYISTNSEPQPWPVGEEMGTVIYAYQPKLSVDYYCRSSYGGSEEITSFETDDTTLNFDSRFESGNLAKVIKITNVYYELYLRPDMYTDRHAQWYYFRIKNTRENIIYRFSIVNLSKPDSLYRYGMKPLMYSEKQAQLNSTGWVRFGHNIAYYKNDITSNDYTSSYTLTFNLTFPYSKDTVYIAQCYPYTYSNLQTYLQSIQSDKDKARLCQQRLLCKSVGGNNVYVLTVTAPESQEEEKPKKPAIVVTARVHPGESPSSYMMKGIIDFLISDSTHAQELRERFIFKLIPMLNPDGVIVGNSRCCLLGQDLNRQYHTVLREAFPQIYQTKVLLRRLVDENGVFLYCDIHGHSRKNNVFMYGCENRRIHEKKLSEQVFPLMMHKNAADKFSFTNSKFRIQKSKEGTGRIFVWTLGVSNSYTLEISLCGSTLGSRERTHFNFIDYEDLGRHFCETLLDYSDTAAVKERIRQKILQKLIKSGSTADDPVNIPISDYSSLSHSDADDESDTTEDDEENDRQRSKTNLSRQISVRNSRNKKIKKTDLNRGAGSLMAPTATNREGNRISRTRKPEPRLMSAKSRTEKIGNSFPSTRFNQPSPKRARRLSLIPKESTAVSSVKYTNIVFESPFKPPEIIVTTKEDERQEIPEPETLTEDECDYSDFSSKNEYYLPSPSSTSSLVTRFQSMTLLPIPKMSKSQRSSPTSSAITSETESHPPLPNKSKKIKSREDEKYGSKKQNVKTRPNKSQGSESKWMSKSGSIFKMVAAVTSPPRNSTSVSSQSKRVLQLASKRRVSWGGSSEATAGITPILSEYSNPINPKKSLSISLERTELPSILRAMHGGISNIESRGGKAGSRRKLLNSMIL